MYKRFVVSNLWLNYSRSERRTWGRYYFIDSIRENVNFKMYYKSSGFKKWSEYHVQSQVINVLIGYIFLDIIECDL